jgi:predicted nucleic acid-binding protein
MVLASAIQMGCPVLWSEDLNDGQEYDSTRIVNPFQN